MNLFEGVKSVVSVPQAAKMYGLEVMRMGMVCCPFHEDKHPSLKLNEDYFYCFGCGAAGDVIALIAKLFGLSNYQSAQKLAYDLAVDSDMLQPVMESKAVWQRQKELSQMEQRYQRLLCDYLHLLERWQREYAPINLTVELDDRFVAACQMVNYVRYLADILTFAEKEQRSKIFAELRQNNTIGRLAGRLEKIQKEALANEKIKEIA